MTMKQPREVKRKRMEKRDHTDLWWFTDGRYLVYCLGKQFWGFQLPVTGGVWVCHGVGLTASSALSSSFVLSLFPEDSTSH